MDPNTADVRLPVWLGNEYLHYKPLKFLGFYSDNCPLKRHGKTILCSHSVVTEMETHQAIGFPVSHFSLDRILLRNTSHVNRIVLESLIKDCHAFPGLEYVQLKWVAVWLIDSGCFCWAILLETIFQLIFYQFTCHAGSDIMNSGTSQTPSILWGECLTFPCDFIYPDPSTHMTILRSHT